MKKFLIVLVLLLVSHDSEATEVACVDHFLLPNLNMSYCSNHCYRTDTEMLYYRGLAEALNTYIDRKREEGKLQGKKLEIRIDLINAGPVTSLSQNRNGYYVQLGPGAVINLRQLLRIVDYFASTNWRSFTYDYWAAPSADMLGMLNRILDREVSQPDMSFFAGWRASVFELDDLQVIYEDDRFFYMLAGQRLNLEPEDPTPVKVGDRYLFGSKGAIHVYENGSEILRKPWEPPAASGPLRARAFQRWVNLGYSGGPHLSYSYKANRFYQLPELPELPVDSEWRKAFGSCGRVHTPPLRGNGSPLAPPD